MNAEPPQATLLGIPQPEKLPRDVELLTSEDQNKYLDQLEPFLAFTGYKKATWGDWLEFNALDVEASLQQMSISYHYSIHSACSYLGANLNTKLDTPLRTLGNARTSPAVSMFDFGLFERTMVELVHRPAEPTQIFAVYFMRRRSATEKRWMSLGEDLARGKRPNGILPVEDVLLYGQKSVLVISHFQMTEASSAFNFRGTLEQLTSAFGSLSSMHSKGISINLWPLIQRRSDGETMQASFVPSYGFWADDPVLNDGLIPGSKAPSKELK